MRVRHRHRAPVKTPSARAKIRKYFSQENKSDDAERGRSELAKELRKRGYGISATRTVKALDQLTEQFDYRSVDDLFAGIGAGNQSAKQVVNRVSEILEEKKPEVVTEQERNAARLQEKNKAIANDQPLVRSYVISLNAKGGRPKKSNCGVELLLIWIPYGINIGQRQSLLRIKTGCHTVKK